MNAHCFYIKDSSPGITSISPGLTPSSRTLTFWFQLYSGLGDMGGIEFLFPIFAVSGSGFDCLEIFFQKRKNKLPAEKKPILASVNPPPPQNYKKAIVTFQGANSSAP